AGAMSARASSLCRLRPPRRRAGRPGRGLIFAQHSMTQLLVILIVIAVVALYLRTQVRRVTIFEFERGMLYVRGRFQKVLEPGQYSIWSTARAITKLGWRPRLASVPGQEALTADGIAVKVSLVAQYRIVDPVVSINQQANYESALY